MLAEPETGVSPAIVDAADGGSGRSGKSNVALALDVFLENRLATVGLFVAGFYVLFCFVGPLIYHTNQVQTNIPLANRPPSLRDPLGTDNTGYDILGRLMGGGQATIVVGFGVAVLATGFGLVWGAVAGFTGGVVDAVMMRVVDTLLGIPSLFLLLFLATLITPSIPLLIGVISLVSWLVPARLVRAETLSLKSRDFVAAAQSQGASPIRVIMTHIVPNTFGTVVVNCTFQVADAILAVAALSYLGLGIPPPAANWGSMLSDGVNYIFSGYWWQIWPAGVSIVALVVAFNLIGDGLRDAVEVRLQRR